MPICRNAVCPVSYQSQDGKLLVSMLRVLRAAHNANRTSSPATIDRLRGLAARIYQAGPLCAGCNGQDMALHTRPEESAEVNDLLLNMEVLQIYGALPAGSSPATVA
jgi:hypothetical protein